MQTVNSCVPFGPFPSPPPLLEEARLLALKAWGGDMDGAAAPGLIEDL